MDHPKLPRRRFLQAGGVLFTLPWLESSGAARTTRRRRNGWCKSAPASACTGRRSSRPKAGRDYEPSEYLTILSDLRDQFTVFSGISHPEIGGDHASEACFLTSAKHPTKGGFRNTVSLDYVAAKHVAGATRFPAADAVDARQQPADLHAQRRRRAGARPAVGDLRADVSGRKRQRCEARNRPAQAGPERARPHGGPPRRVEQERQRSTISSSSPTTRRRCATWKRQLQADEAWVNRPKPKVNDPQPNENYPSPFADRSDSIGRARVMLNLVRLALQDRFDARRVALHPRHGREAADPRRDRRAPRPDASRPQPGKRSSNCKIVEKLEMTAFRDFLVSLRDTKEGGQTLLDSTQVLDRQQSRRRQRSRHDNLPILLAGGGYKHGQHIAGDVKDNTPLAQAVRQHAAEIRRGSRQVRLGQGHDRRAGVTAGRPSEGWHAELLRRAW